MPSSACERSPKAVSKTKYVYGPGFARTMRHSSGPSMPGMSQSLMITSAPSARNRSQASVPSAAVRQSCPRRSTADFSILRAVLPSSTTSTFISHSDHRLCGSSPKAIWERSPGGRWTSSPCCASYALFSPRTKTPNAAATRRRPRSEPRSCCARPGLPPKASNACPSASARPSKTCARCNLHGEPDAVSAVGFGAVERLIGRPQCVDHGLARGHPQRPDAGRHVHPGKRLGSHHRNGISNAFGDLEQVRVRADIGTDADLLEVTERVRNAIAVVRPEAFPRVNVTASVGALRVPPGKAVVDALRSADQALYRAKADGRNRVRLAV